MNKFHRRCGDRVTLLNHNFTAIRNFVEFNHGLILSADPLTDDVMFEVRIDRKVNVWNGSLEIGVTTLDPEYMELPATATKLRNTAWILSGNSIVKDGVTLVNIYGPELDSLREGDCVGVTRSSKGELMFSINGRCLGVAAKDMPTRLFAVIDLYGQCVQVSIMNNSYTNASLAVESVDEIVQFPEDNEEHQQAEAAAWPEPKPSQNTHIQMPIACPLVSQDHLRFHPRCGILVKLSSNNKTAERARPLDDYNNGVVMTHRPLYDNELFEIRIEKLVDKWSGSIEVGVTSHNPATIRFPSTMTNMESGTIMMSGCKVLINGHGTCMEYGNFNLDELREGDTVGMMRKGNDKLHYFINGIDQGIATDKVASQVWGVIDLYGMTVKVTIVDPCEDLDSNTHHQPIRVLSTPQLPARSYRPAIDEESLLFHTVRDSNVIVISNGKTAHRPNAFELFSNGIVMTNRTLKTNELFQVRLDLVIPKWTGSIEIGVTQHSSKDIKFPYKMSDEKSGAWVISGEDVMRDGSVIIPQYVRNLNKLVEGDTVGVMRKDMGILHFYVNGIDQGPAAFNIPEHVFAMIDLYGRVAQATIVDMYMPPLSMSPESPISSESNATVFPEMCFHRVHGRNSRLSRNRLVASRAAVYSEFNNAVLFSSRPLRECDMFEIRIEKTIDCWIGSLEIGVTAIRPDDLDSGYGLSSIAGTATDLTWDTYILSGSAMMKDGECVRSGYPLDLDTLVEGSRVGIMWHADRSLHYYLDGMDMGKAWYVPHLNIYAVVDLYGQCTQVSIVQIGDRNYNYNGCNTEHYNRRKCHITPPPPYWTFSEYCGKNVLLRKECNIAHRIAPEPLATIVFSAFHLAVDEIYEIQIAECKHCYAGTFRMGITDINILNANVNRNLPLSMIWLPHYTAFIEGRHINFSRPDGSNKHKLKAFRPSFEWLRPGDRVGFKKTADSRVLIYYNSELLDVAFENVPDKVYVACELGGPVFMIKSVPRGAPVVPASQQTIKNDCETMEQTQKKAVCNANATDNATGEDITTGEASGITSGPTTLALRTGAVVAPTEYLPTPNVPGPSGLTGPAKFFEMVEPTTSNEAFLPSAPTMAALELEAPTSPQPCSSPQPSTSPQPPNDDAVEAVNDTTDEVDVEVDPTAAPNDDEAVAGPSDEDGAENPPPRKQYRPLPYTFYELHGKNIRLRSSDTVAVRYRGYADGVAIASQSLKRGNHFRFRVDKITNDWVGTVCIGAVAALPTDIPPRSALHIDQPSWILTSDVLMNKGRYKTTDMGRSLDDITENSVLTLHFKFNSELTVDVDGVTRGVIGVISRTYTHVYPAIDLYGKVTQISILLHPHIILGGNSLDLPVIDETYPDESQATPDDEDYGGDEEDDGDDEDSPDIVICGIRGIPTQQQLKEWRYTKRVYEVTETKDPNESENYQGPGPSRRPDCLPGLPHVKDVRNQQIKTKHMLPHQRSLYHSLMATYGYEPNDSDLEEPTTQFVPVRRCLSTEQFIRATEHSDSEEEEEEINDEEDEDDDEDDNENDNGDSNDSPVNALSLGSRMGDDDDSLDVPEICDTNIRHNDRYPEASDVDLLDNEIVDALTLDAGNLPDLTEEQSPSIDDSTRRDEVWSDGILHIENLTYLNNIINYNPEEVGPRFSERDWVFYSETNGNCEHMHLALKYWNYLVLPYPDMREVVASGQVRCFCANCHPDAEQQLAGWVRIERANAGGTNHMFWHLLRSTLVAASAMPSEAAGGARRPRVLCTTPSTNPTAADIWFDEEGKPHHTVIALDIDVSPDMDPAKDRLLAYLIYLRSHVTMNEETADPLSFED